MRSTTRSGRRQLVATGASSAFRRIRWSPRTSSATPCRGRRPRPHPGRGRHAGEGDGLVRQRMGLHPADDPRGPQHARRDRMSQTTGPSRRRHLTPELWPRIRARWSWPTVPRASTASSARSQPASATPSHPYGERLRTPQRSRRSPERYASARDDSIRFDMPVPHVLPTLRSLSAGPHGRALRRRHENPVHQWVDAATADHRRRRRPRSADSRRGGRRRADADGHRGISRTDQRARQERGRVLVHRCSGWVSIFAPLRASRRKPCHRPVGLTVPWDAPPPFRRSSRKSINSIAASK